MKCLAMDNLALRNLPTGLEEVSIIVQVRAFAGWLYDSMSRLWRPSYRAPWPWIFRLVENQDGDGRQTKFQGHL
jgi:hypothetical protein